MALGDMGKINKPYSGGHVNFLFSPTHMLGIASSQHLITCLAPKTNWKGEFLLRLLSNGFPLNKVPS